MANTDQSGVVVIGASAQHAWDVELAPGQAVLAPRRAVEHLRIRAQVRAGQLELALDRGTEGLQHLRPAGAEAEEEGVVRLPGEGTQPAQ